MGKPCYFENKAKQICIVNICFFCLVSAFWFLLKFGFQIIATDHVNEGNLNKIIIALSKNCSWLVYCCRKEMVWWSYTSIIGLLHHYQVMYPVIDVGIVFFFSQRHAEIYTSHFLSALLVSLLTLGSFLLRFLQNKYRFMSYQFLQKFLIWLIKIVLFRNARLRFTFRTSFLHYLILFSHLEAFL